MSRARKVARFAALAGGVCVAAGVLALAAWQDYRVSAGDPSARLADTWHEGRRALDREGRDLREMPSAAGLRGRRVSLDAMGDRIVLSTVAAEDNGFYEHDGLDEGAVLRALGQDLAAGRVVSGASTITQQLVKLLDNEGQPRPRTLAAKMIETARAENLEEIVGKQTILEAYLNRLPYGHGLAGPEAAAQGYFGVAARDLSWAQAAYLAVLPRAPSFLDPYKHAERVTPRQQAVLAALHTHGLLDDASFARASAEEVTPRPLARPALARHFVEALDQGGELAGGEGTVTSLDLDLQEDVEGLVSTHLAAIRSFSASNAAVLVVDNATGELLAYAGSADFDDASIAGQVDMVRAPRQPGSTLKPFVYALAFEGGHTASEMLADVPTSFAEQGGAYAPGNFDGTFEGPISAREALAGSLNVPAVRLASELPAGSLLSKLRELGFGTLNQEAAHYGLSLALGSGEVRLRDLAGAYVALARGGERIPLRALVSEGVIAEADRARVLDAGAAAMVTEVLSDPLARVRGLHGRGPFDLEFPVAVKTGTSSGYRDAWTAGYTHERTVVVWVGNADGAPMKGLTGAGGAGPLFADVMRRAMEDVSARAPLWDESQLEMAAVCPLSGKLAGPSCSEHVERHFIRGHVPVESCDVHVRVREGGGARAGEAPFRCDPGGDRRAVVLPSVFDGWLASRSIGAPGEDPFGVPWFSRRRLPGCVKDASGAPELRVDEPATGSVFVLSRRGDEGAEAVMARASFSGDSAAGRRMGEVEFVVDGQVAARSAYPFQASLPLARGDHEIVARPVDPAMRVAVAGARFSVR